MQRVELTGPWAEGLDAVLVRLHQMDLVLEVIFPEQMIKELEMSTTPVRWDPQMALFPSLPYRSGKILQIGR